jgi:transcriptional regulator with XRE-family HTH domain
MLGGSVTRLHALRRSRGLSGRAAARLIGVSHSTLLRLERGDSWGSPTSREALEAYFSLPIADILQLDK